MATMIQRGTSYIGALFNATPTQAQIDRAKAAFAVGLPSDATTAQIVEVMLREARQAFLDRLAQREVEAAVVALRDGKAAELVAAFPETAE